MALFLRTSDRDGKAYGGFQWPMEIGAVVTAPDWERTANCGCGLHGLLDGLGDSSHLSFAADAVWWIVEAESPVDLNGKRKFASCRVVAFGPRQEVTAQLHAMRPGPIHGLCLTGGDRSTLTGGDRSTLTGGYWSTLTGDYRSTLTGGNRSTLTGGDRSTLTGGYMSTLTGGNESTLTGGDRSTLTGGDRSTLTGGNESTLTGGDGSTLTGGDWSTLTGGDWSTLTGGYRSTLTGGYRSTLIFLLWIHGRRRVLTAYVGEDGIDPGKAYRASDDFKTVEAA